MRWLNRLCKEQNDGKLEARITEKRNRNTTVQGLGDTVARVCGGVYFFYILGI